MKYYKYIMNGKTYLAYSDGSKYDEKPLVKWVNRHWNETYLYVMNSSNEDFSEISKEEFIIISIIES